MGWRTSPRQMPAVTFPDYGYTQAGIPATVQCPRGNEEQALGGFLQQRRWGCMGHACIKHDADTLSHKRTNKDLFLSHPLSPLTHTHTNTPPLSHQTKKSHSHLAFVFNGKRYNWRFFSGQMTLQTSRVFISCDGILTPGCSC